MVKLLARASKVHNHSLAQAGEAFPPKHGDGFIISEQCLMDSVAT